MIGYSNQMFCNSLLQSITIVLQTHLRIVICDSSLLFCLRITHNHICARDMYPHLQAVKAQILSLAPRAKPILSICIVVPVANFPS